MKRSRAPQESIDVDRSRKVTFGAIALKPAPTLDLDRLTVEVTLKVCEAEAGTLQFNS